MKNFITALAILVMILLAGTVFANSTTSTVSNEVDQKVVVGDVTTVQASVVTPQAVTVTPELNVWVQVNKATPHTKVVITELGGGIIKIEADGWVWTGYKNTCTAIMFIDRANDEKTAEVKSSTPQATYVDVSDPTFSGAVKMTPDRIKGQQSADELLKQYNEEQKYQQWLKEQQKLPCPREDGDLGLPVSNDKITQE